MNKQRIVYLDFIRIIAIVLVLYNHRGCYWWTPSDGNLSLTLIKLSFYGLICKMGAPLFLTISGILLLNKEERYAYIFKHRVLRILCVMLLLSFYNVLIEKSQNNIYQVMTTQLNWYLYAYVLFLLMLPFLRSIASCSDEYKMIFIVIVGILYAISGQSYVTHFNPLYNLLNTQSIFYATGTHGGWIIIYPLAGAFVKQLMENDPKHLKKLVFCGGGGINCARNCALYC